MNSKVCTACRQEKPLSEFHRYGKDGARIGKWCEPCYAAKNADKKRLPNKVVIAT